MLSDDRSGMSFEQRNQGKKKALIIAVSEYDNLPKGSQLPFCENDGKAIYDVLTSQKYDIPDDRKLIGRVSGYELRNAILDFFIKSEKSDDTLFFYFSGHGIADSIGDHYLTSSDIEKEYPEENGYKFDDLEKMMKKSNAKKIVLVLDCCLSGAIGADSKGGDEAAEKARGVMNKVFDNASGRCVLASSLEGQSSYPMKASKYSLFTHYLLEGLRGGNGEATEQNGDVTPIKLSNYVFDKIPLAKQKPITKVSMSGDIVIASHPEYAKPKSDLLYQLLKDENVDQFNLVRKGSVNLADRNFQRRNLSQADFSNANLRGVNMREANLQWADFSGADLANSSLEFADLRKAKFKGANLEKASFQFSLLGGAEDLDRAGLDPSAFTGADFAALPDDARSKIGDNDVFIFDPKLAPAKTVRVASYNVRYLDYSNPIWMNGVHGETTILLHGLIGLADSWLLMTPSLSRYLKMVVPDILGSGYSEKPQANYDLEFYMKFLLGFFESLSIKRANIIAMSFGARLAIEFALRFPSMVNRLVLCSPPILPSGFDCVNSAKAVVKMSGNELLKTFLESEDLGNYYYEDIDADRVTKNTVNIFADMIKQPDLQRAYQSTLCELTNYPPLGGRLSGISCPTLLVWGEKDTTSPISNADQFLEIPNVQYVRIEDCGHYIIFQKPVEFNKAILKFFQESK